MSGLFMLDTNTASYVIKGNAPAIDARLRKLDVMQVCISAITRAELRFGVRRLSSATRLSAEVERFLSGVHTLAWDEVAADQFAEVRADLERAGTPIGSMDTMIAAHAKAINAVLVTNNLKHFRRVKGLAIENWIK
ncbi:MAG TPA: type II toxin-antitoxin system VapC family toxin [Bryobacteraceae bacterium]